MHIHDALRRSTVAAAAIAGAVLVASAPAAESANICTENTEPGVKCDCTLDSLRPLQGAVGLGEVAKKTKDIEEKEDKERKDLAKDPIKVVRGPDKALFVIDHHHGARAWLNAGHNMGTCVIRQVLPINVEEFRAELEKRNWKRLKNENGADITWDQLPAKLTNLPDDPYRTLAWMVRKEDGYCRALMTPSPPPFVEFSWADFFRTKKTELPPDAVKNATAPGLWHLKKKEREAKQEAVLDAALALARTDLAQKLPGWNGKKDDKGSYPECAADPNDDGGVGG